MEELGRCESCGKLVPEIELTSVDVWYVWSKPEEELWCESCIQEDSQWL